MNRKLLANAGRPNTGRDIALFSGLAEKDRNALLEGGSVHSYARKSPLFRRGDPIQYFYIVYSGIVQEFRETLDGHELTISIHKAGDTFCKTEMFLEDGLHHTSTTAVNSVKVMQLPIEPFKRACQEHSLIMNNILSSLAQFAFMKQMEVEQRVTMKSTQIVASFLRQMRVNHGHGLHEFTLPYKKTLIASRLGMKIETLSRAFSRLQSQGITIKGNQVTFHDSQDTGRAGSGHYQSVGSRERHNNNHAAD